MPDGEELIATLTKKEISTAVCYWVQHRRPDLMSKVERMEWQGLKFCYVMRRIKPWTFLDWIRRRTDDTAEIVCAVYAVRDGIPEQTADLENND